MTAKVRIYRPSKTATQSGLANTRRWVLEYESQDARAIEPLMGWTSSGDTTQQIFLTFESRDQAIAFALKNGMEFRVDEPRVQRTTSKSYAENFRYDKIS